MSYRDEHEALRARADGLARDLARQGEELAEGRAAKEQARELQRELDQARGRLVYLERKLTPQPRGRRARPALVALSIALMLVGVVLVFWFQRSPAPRIVTPVAAPSPAVPAPSPPVVTPASHPVEPVSVDLSGPLDRAAVQRVVGQHMREVRGCHERELVKNPGLSGKLVVDWTIGPGGSVTSARMVSSTLGSPRVARCILMLMRGWRFPPPSSGDPFQVRYPFLFRAHD